jgi:hypothetical protein
MLSTGSVTASASTARSARRQLAAAAVKRQKSERSGPEEHVPAARHHARSLSGYYSIHPTRSHEVWQRPPVPLLVLGQTLSRLSTAVNWSHVADAA